MSGFDATKAHQGIRRGRSRGFLSLIQLVLAVLFHAGASYGLPFTAASNLLYKTSEDEEPIPAEDPGLWIYLTIALVLVLMGGAFAGLTIALMGQDEMYLQVISTSGEGSEKKSAAQVLRLLQRGKHWVLVTLLVGNVITNETLPIVLDRSIGGGYAAAISSTVLVIIFGEIVPQSICVRFGLPIGAWCSPMVLLLMWIFAPITWPIAKLLDYLLGEEHGTTYKKAGLKTLVTLHQTVGTTPGERLNDDEVAIISGVLDLKAKPVGAIMTPMSDVFILSADAVLDEDMIENIMSEGYSRIPIHDPSNTGDFVGMLLVKILITYDPEDAKLVKDFSLATLPETRPDTSCLDIINFFQEGKSHMVLVSASPGEPYGALGVVTLEDVIEELIGEEIIDESDVFRDVHKAIRRLQPAPTHHYRSRVQKGDVIEDENSRATAEEGEMNMDGTENFSVNGNGEVEGRRGAKRASTVSMDYGRSPKRTTFAMRRTSSRGSGSQIRTMQGNAYTAEMRQQLRHLGPSNVASRPKPTRISTVKVKPGVGSIPENSQMARQITETRLQSEPESQTIVSPEPSAAQGGIGEGLATPGLDAKDGVQQLQAGYGTWDRNASTTAYNEQGSFKHGRGRSEPGKNGEEESKESYEKKKRAPPDRPQKITIQRSGSQSTLGSLHSQGSGESRNRGTARSGSITERIVETGGRKKLVLNPSSSSDEGPLSSKARKDHKSESSRQHSRQASHQGRSSEDVAGEDQQGSSKAKKKRRNRNYKKKKGTDGKGGGDENMPLLAPPRG